MQIELENPEEQKRMDKVAKVVTSFIAAVQEPANDSEETIEKVEVVNLDKIEQAISDLKEGGEPIDLSTTNELLSNIVEELKKNSDIKITLKLS